MSQPTSQQHLQCPGCGKQEQSKVLETRGLGLRGVERRRRCLSCATTFRTVEVVIDDSTTSLLHRLTDLEHRVAKLEAQDTTIKS